MYFILHNNNYGESEYSDEEYGEWYMYNRINYNGYETVEEGVGFWDVGLHPADTSEPSDIVHFVIIQYTTGDSFGQETGIKTPVWAFYNYNLAKELQDAMLENEKTVSFEWRDTIINMSDYNSYFDCIEQIYIETLDQKLN